MRRKIDNVMMGLFVSVVFGLAGCGGGGGGGDSNDVGSSYKGNATQASITESNAKAMSVDAIQWAQDATTVGVLDKSVSDTPETSPQLQSIARILEGTALRISSRSVVAKTVATTVKGTEYGFSGSYGFYGNVNESTGNISGSITFNQYQEFPGDPAISGKVSFSGTVSTSTGNIKNINMYMHGLQVGSGSQSPYTITGSLAIDIAGTTETVNMSVVRLDNTNNTYWHKDFSFVLTGNSMTISGTYYDHVYGYVVVTTVIPLTVSEYSSRPTSGQLLFTGKNGTKARLTYTYSGYTLEVDATGNNIFVMIP